MKALLALALEHSVKHWLFRLGGIGLILVGLIDNSFIPIPGGMDVFTILLSAKNKDLWPYYSFMAVLGSVIGGYLTYRLAVKGGKETLESKIGKKRAEKVYQKFDKAAFTTVFVGALMPPPFPIVPVLLAAGAMQYPRKKFIAALAAARAIRFTLDGILGAIYGRAILSFFSQYYKPLLYTFISLGVVGGFGAFIYYKHWKKKQQQQGGNPTSQPHPRHAA